MKLITGILLAGVLFAETKVRMENLPAAVQVAVKEQTKSATLVGLSKEVENGKTLYEVETKVGGKTRDLLLDTKGGVVETEGEVELTSIPDAAQASLRKKASGGAIQKVEKLTQGATVAYEAAIKTKAGRTIEAAVNADGTPHKE